MGATIEEIKTLRDRTGVSIMQCKKALEETGGDAEKAIDVLRKGGSVIALKKSGRNLGSGVVQAYIHNGGATGSMCELLCETDFVAKNEEFKALAYDIAMQVAATDEGILEGDLDEFLKQPFIKNPDRKISDLVQDAVQKFGERMEIGRVVKFSI